MLHSASLTHPLLRTNHLLPPSTLDHISSDDDRIGPETPRPGRGRCATYPTDVVATNRGRRRQLCSLTVTASWPRRFIPPGTAPHNSVLQEPRAGRLDDGTRTGPIGPRLRRSQIDGPDGHRCDCVPGCSLHCAAGLSPIRPSSSPLSDTSATATVHEVPRTRLLRPLSICGFTSL